MVWSQKIQFSFCEHKIFIYGFFRKIKSLDILETWKSLEIPKIPKNIVVEHVTIILGTKKILINTYQPININSVWVETNWKFWKSQKSPHTIACVIKYSKQIVVYGNTNKHVVL